MGLVLWSDAGLSIVLTVREPLGSLAHLQRGKLELTLILPNRDATCLAKLPVRLTVLLIADLSCFGTMHCILHPCRYCAWLCISERTMRGGAGFRLGAQTERIRNQRRPPLSRKAALWRVGRAYLTMEGPLSLLATR